MFERASKKLGLDQAVLTKMNSGSSAVADVSSENKNDIPLDKKTIDSLSNWKPFRAHARGRRKISEELSDG